MSDGGRVSATTLVRFGPLVVALVIASIAVLVALPPRIVRIETGPIGGSYYHTALKYKQIMQQHDITVKLVPDPDSLRIISDVNRQGSGIDVGFVAQAVQPDRYPNTRAAGIIGLQPLFIFYDAGLGDLTGPAALRGKLIVMPPEDSATSEAALDLLKLYGVTPANSKIEFMQLKAAIKALKDHRADAAIIMLRASNKLIAGLAASSDVRLLNLSEARGITRHLPYLTTAVLPRGSYDVTPNIPSHNVNLVAATVDIVVKRDINPGVLYELLEAMRRTSRGGTLVSNPGDYPSVAGTDLPPDPLAVQYMKSGLPWIYQQLPLWLASLIERYLVIGIAIFICAELYRKFADLAELAHLVVEQTCLWLLGRMERSAERGVPITGLSLASLRVIEHILVSGDRQQRGRELSRRIRNHISQNP